MDQETFNKMFAKATYQVEFEGWDDDKPVSGKRTLKRWAGGIVEAAKHAEDAAKHSAGEGHDHEFSGRTKEA